MSKNSLGFHAKDRIDHPVYGPGTIVEVNERHTTISFDGVGKKKFMTSMVRLTASDTPAPAKPVRSKKKPKAAASEK
jgi:hypothetical protein